MTNRFRDALTPAARRLVCEAVNGFGVIFFSGLGNRLRPLRMVDGVGIILGLQRDAAAFAVFHAVLALAFKEIPGIELESESLWNIP